MKLVLYMIVVSGMLAGGQVLIKIGLDKVGGFSGSSSILYQFVKIFSSAWVLGGIAMIGSQMLLWFWILAKYDLTKAYPLISMSYIFGLIFAVLFLKEQPAALRILGTMLIVLGVILVAKV